MSLTNYLNNKDCQDLRDSFKSTFQRPLFNLDGEIKANNLTSNYGIVGTAFDYLIRFQIEHINSVRVGKSKWIADFSYNRLLNKFKGEKKEELTYRYHRAKDNYRTFNSTGKAHYDLFADTLFLAKLDLYFRSRLIAPDLLYEHNLDILDLENLYATVNPNNFIAKKKLILNPTFGIGSLLVGGADADIIIDDILIDIKVTKHLKLTRDYLNQIIGYYILSLIGGINNARNTCIRKIGIYFARHGLLWTCSISDLADSKTIHSFKEWFVDYFENRNNF